MHFLKNIFFDPVISIINKRYQLTEGAKIEAEEINKQAQLLLEQYQEKIRKAKIQVYENIKKQSILLQQQKITEIQKAKKELDEVVNKTISDLNKHLNEIEPELKKESITIAALISKNILNREISNYEIKS